MTRVRIATRGSALALAQAESVAERVRKVLGRETELVVVKTSGDRLRDVSLAKLGGKGLFVKEIEESLVEERADLAVHSAKDLPAVLAAGLALVAFPERADPRDALVAREPGAMLDALPRAARIGTGSARRTALLLAHRPDLELVPLRGNVPTRLQKLESDDLAAVVLACAGLDRLGFGARASERLPPEVMLPAVCQGTLALQAREGSAIAGELSALDDATCRTRAAAERAFLTRLGGDCNVPLAAFAEVENGGVRLRGLLASPDGERVLRTEMRAPLREAAAAGARAADALLADGGQAILDRARGAPV